MKNLLILLFTLLISTTSFACSCNKIVSFYQGAKRVDKVILGKILKREFIIDDGTKLYDEGILKDYFTENKGKVFHYIEIVSIEVIETIRGEKEEKVVEVYGGNYNSCWSSMEYFKINEFYIISLLESFNPLSNEKSEKENIGYELGVCYNSSLKVNSELTEVTGILKKKKISTISYKKLKRKIT